MHRIVALVLVLVAAGAVVARADDAPIVIVHEGYLLDSEDKPVTNATLHLGLSLWSVALDTGAAFRVWPAAGDSDCPVSVRDGRYSAVLDGASTTCGAALSTAHFPPGADRYLQISVENVVLSPRLRIGTVPLAAVAQRSLDAQTLIARLGKDTGTLNATDNPVHWSQIRGVPAAFADGTDDGATYSAAAGGGLALANGAFSLAPTGVVAGEYGPASITVDAAGRLVGASPAMIGSTSLSSDAASLAKVSAGAISVGSNGIAITNGLGITGDTNIGGNLGLGLNGAATVRLDVAGDAHVSGTITAGAFKGSGVQLTGVDAATLGGKSFGDLQTLFSTSGPVSKIPVSSGVPSSAPCGASAKGWLFYDTAGAVLRVCDGANYVPLAIASPGSSSAFPATSCATVRAAQPSPVSGLYWINTTGSASQVWCEFVVGVGSGFNTGTMPAFFQNTALQYYWDFSQTKNFDWKRRRDLAIPTGVFDSSAGVRFTQLARNAATFPYTTNATLVMRMRRDFAPATAIRGFVFNTADTDDGVSIDGNGIGTRTHSDPANHADMGTLLANVLPTQSQFAVFAMKVNSAGATFYSATTKFTPANVGPGTASYDTCTMSGNMWIGAAGSAPDAFTGGELYLDRFAVFNAELSDADTQAFITQVAGF